MVHPQINDIKQRLYGAKGGNREFQKEDIIETYHRFNVVYGYIPFDEFKKIKMPLLFKLLKKVDEEYKRQREIHQAMLALAGVKKR